MEDLNSLKNKLKDTILKQIKLDELTRDPLGYSFIFWKISSNSINLEINKDIKAAIQDWLNRFLDNQGINDFIDRNIAAASFIFHKLKTEIKLEEQDVRKLFPNIKRHYDKTSRLFFKNMLYTVIVLDALNGLSIQDEELLGYLKEAEEKIVDSINKEIVFNDPKILPFLCEHYNDDNRKKFVELIKKRVSIEPDSIVDQDRIYYAWALVKYIEQIDRDKLAIVTSFVSSAISVVENLLEGLSDETLENIYGRNIRDAIPFYWLGFTYELIANYNSFLGSISSDFESKMTNLLKGYELDSIHRSYITATQKIQSATITNDINEKSKIAPEAVYYLGLILEGTLKFICHKIASETFPNDKYSSFSQTIEHCVKKLKDKKYRFLVNNETLDREIGDLKDKFRNIADHFKVDQGVLVLKGKFQQKQVSLEEAVMCLGKTQVVVSMLLERLKERLGNSIKV